jgi:hypothetical protein
MSPIRAALGLLVLLAVLAFPSVSFAGAHYKTSVTCGADRVCVQGDLPFAIFRDVRHAGVRYRVCVSGPDGRTCASRRSGRPGRRSAVPLYTATVGRYVVHWRVEGKVVGTRRYRIISEGV